MSILSVRAGSRVREISCPPATTALYVAKRAAEAFGLNPDLYWCLAGLAGGPVEDGVLAADLEGVELRLGRLLDER